MGVTTGPETSRGSVVVIDELDSFDLSEVPPVAFGQDYSVLLAGPGPGTPCQSRLAFALLADGIELLVVRCVKTGTSDLFDRMRRTTSVQAVIGRVGDSGVLLDCVGDDGLVFRAGGGDADLAYMTTRIDGGWRLFRITTEYRARDTTAASVALAGLRIWFDLDPGDDHRIGALRDKLIEAGALVDLETRPGPDDDVLLCRDASALDPQRCAVGINLGGPQDAPLGVWIQGRSLCSKYLPQLSSAFEAVAATPLNQWRRWMF